MKAKKRYIVFLTSCAFLALVYFGGHRLKRPKPTLTPKARMIVEEIEEDEFRSVISDIKSSTINWETCRMATCFNFTRCKDEFKVYIHPETEGQSPPSENYLKILNSIRDSPYYTKDSNKACLFVLSLDTLDRDPMSVHNYVRNLDAKIKSLGPLWNNGENHVIFNLFSGTYHDYLETDLQFDPGKAIMAKGSISEGIYRPHFDVSIPLYHASHPEKGGQPGYATSYEFPVIKKHFLAFKGKRYLYGIGSESRNSLYHLHNGQDVVLVTTCKHGKNWKEFKDDRCDEDNQEYDRWDYQSLLKNSTFCLVPRGRRLGSFRFIETLQAGCVPVLLSNGWRLPFAEVIDWSQAVFQADERLLMQVPEMLRSVSPAKIFEMRQQTQILWDRYLSSVDKIVMTTLEIIKERVYLGLSAREGNIWNSYPGALLTSPKYSSAPSDFPFDNGYNNIGIECIGCDMKSYKTHRNLLTKIHSKNNNISHFTAVIYTQSSYTSTTSTSNNPVFKLVASVAASKFIDKILIYWTLPIKPPPLHQWPLLTKGRWLPPIHIEVLNGTKNISKRFSPHPEIRTDAVLSLDEDSSITTEEVDYSFSVWKGFKDRIVGFPARSHFWNPTKKKWVYTSKWNNDYSMVLTGVAFYHRYYHHLYTHWLSPGLRQAVDDAGNCEDILMNFLVSHVTKSPPIKVTQKKSYKEKVPQGSMSPWDSPDHFAQRQVCINLFATQFGYMPLKKSLVRFDPVLYKDAVSTMRKKYPKLEKIQVRSRA